MGSSRWTRYSPVAALLLPLALASCGGDSNSPSSCEASLLTAPGNTHINASSAASGDCGDQLMITGAALDPFTLELTLYGNFPSTINGNDLKVHVGDAILPNSGYAPGSIRADIALLAASGSDLWVTSTAPGIRESNRVQLTYWALHPIQASDLYTTSNQGSTSNLTQQVVWDADLVGILNEGLSPKALVVWFTTTAEFSASGQRYDPPDRTVTWSGAGTILYGPANDDSYQNGYAVYDDTGDPKTITLHLSAFVSDAIQAAIQPPGTFDVLALTLEIFPAMMELDSNFTIQGDVTGSDRSQGVHSTVGWNTTEAVNPPRP